MRWRLLLEEFGPHIHHIAGVDNIVADTLSRIKSSNVEVEKELIRVEQTIELNKRDSKLKALVEDENSDYNFADVDDVKLVLKDNKIYIPAESNALWIRSLTISLSS